jgi:hypothetical protein
MKATVKPPQFVRLKGLPGARSVVRAIHVRSRTDAVRWLYKKKSITVSGELGTANVFYTAKGELVAELSRFHTTVDSVACRSSLTPCKSVAAAYRWLKNMWPALGCD